MLKMHQKEKVETRRLKITLTKHSLPVNQQAGSAVDEGAKVITTFLHDLNQLRTHSAK